MLTWSNPGYSQHRCDVSKPSRTAKGKDLQSKTNAYHAGLQGRKAKEATAQGLLQLRKRNRWSHSHSRKALGIELSTFAQNDHEIPLTTLSGLLFITPKSSPPPPGVCTWRTEIDLLCLPQLLSTKVPNREPAEKARLTGQGALGAHLTLHAQVYSDTLPRLDFWMCMLWTELVFISMGLVRCLLSHLNSPHLNSPDTVNSLT